MAATDAPTHALGSTSGSWGNSYGYGAPTDPLEHIGDLVFPVSIPVLARMRSDPTIASALAAYTTALIAADWHIDPAGATPAMTAICADSLGLPIAGEDPERIGAGRARGVKWREHLRLMCLHLVYGFMPFEPVYEVRDGKAYLKYLAERMPSTIIEVKTNADGTLKSIVQEGTGDGAAPNGVEIPADRLIWYVNDREGANWTGRPLIRPCYSAWLLKLDTLRVNAVSIARFGAGTPVMEPLPGTSPTSVQIAEAQRLASSVRVGQTGGAVPNGFTLKIKGIEGSLPDAIPTLRLYDEQISRALLTSLLDLGNTANGSRALGDNFADVMQRALQAIGNGAAETATQLCERLTSLNEGETAISPVVRCGQVGASKAAIAAAVSGLVTAGLVTPDASLEAYAREGYHLPPKDPTPEPAPVEPTAVAASGWQPWVYAAEGGADRNRGGAENFRLYWTVGPGAALIGYGTSGQFERCVAQLEKHMSTDNAKGYCANRIKEVTGEWPGAHHGKVHAADGDDMWPPPGAFKLTDELAISGPRVVNAAEQPPPAEPQPYREPTPQELAAGIDPAQIDEQADGLVADGMTLFAAIVAVWGTALAAQITAALGAGSLAALARLTVDTTDAAQGLAVLMREAADAGVRHVLEEADRAGVRTGLTPADVHVDEAALDDAAEAASELMGQGLARAAGKEAARIGAGVDPQESARTAVATVAESQTPIHDALAAEVTRAMGVGRTAAQQAVQLATGSQLLPFHSALRDRSTCLVCAAHDGTVYDDLGEAVRDFPSGHYADCLGRARCRCVIGLVPVQL